MDLNGDEYISKPELLMNIFKAMDLNGDGYISKPELIMNI